MLKFLSFGSGSSGNCYLLESSEESILIDAGVGYRKVKKYFSEYGVNQEKISAIFLTHDHTDHISAVSGLAIYLKIPVFATEIVHQRINTNFRIHKKLPKNLVKPIQKLQPVKIGAFTVEAFDVPHDSADCCGYTITYNDKRFVLITDCGKITEEVSSRALEADYLVLESNYDPQMLETGPYSRYLKDRIRNGHGHLSNVQCALALAENLTSRLKHIWLCHLSQENNKPELALATVCHTLEDAGIRVGEDVKVEALRRTLPTGIFSLT